MYGNLDITYCSNTKCKNRECERNQIHLRNSFIFGDNPTTCNHLISFSEFKECKDRRFKWKK